MDTQPDTVTLTPWQKRIGSFAKSVGGDENGINEALKPLVGEPSDQALAVLSDASAVLDSDLQTALVNKDSKIPLGLFRKYLPELRGPQKPVEIPADRVPGYDLLPSVPDDASFLEALKVGGVLKVGKIEVMAAMKAAIASHLGLFEIPDVLVKKMEAFAESVEDPVGENFFKLHRMITTRDYADVLAAINVKGTFVTGARRNKFLDRLNTELWAELVSFHSQVVSWQNNWMAGASNPAAMMVMMTAGSRAGAMPPGILTPPDTAPVRDAAEAFIDKINRVFGGFGIPVARALAYDATRIKEALEDATLPAAVGAINKEQMLKMLDLAVSADYVRTERNITRYALSVMELPNVTAGNEEVNFLVALFQLGTSIQWDKLPGSPTTARLGIGAKRV